MNFIKKKLKSHKKDDDEEADYERAVYEQSLQPQTGEEKHKNSEEWQFFQQLSMKVQDTVQKTQTTLNKLKDIRQDSLSNKEDIYETAGYMESEMSQNFGADDRIGPFGTPKIAKAPPRPPPPSAEKAWVTVESDSELDLVQGSPSKAPPRPPPPGTEKSSEIQIGSSLSALQGTPAKSSPSPARPPPPSTTKPPFPIADESYPPLIKSTDPLPSGSQTQPCDNSFSLLDEFGFQSEVSAPSSTVQANFQDLLFLDEKEEVDPFDTSFVDVTNISSKTETSAKDYKITEQNFNPFSKSEDTTKPLAATVDSWIDGQSDFSKTGAKVVTNPFLADPSSAVLDLMDEAQDVSSAQQWSSHNPFSDAEHSATEFQNNDFFGDSLLCPTEKSIHSDTTTFQKNEQSLLDALDGDKGNGNDLLSSTVNQDAIFKVDDIFSMDNIPHEDIGTENILSSKPEERIDQRDQLWQLDNIEENQGSLIFPHAAEQEKQELNSVESYSNQTDTALFWDSDITKTETVPITPIVADDQNKETTTVKDSETFVPVQDEPNITSTNLLDDFFGSDDKVQIKEPESSSAHDDPFGGMTDFPVESNTTTVTTSELEFQSEENASKELEFPVTSFAPDQSSGLFGTLAETKDSKENLDFNVSSKLSNDTNIEFVPDEVKEISKTELPTDSTQQNGTNISLPFADDMAFDAFSLKFDQMELNQNQDLDFDAFAAKFESAKENQDGGDLYDPFMTKKAPMLKKIQEANKGFGSMDEFDPFKVGTRNSEESPNILKKEVSRDSFEDYDNETDFSVVIKPKVKEKSDTFHLSAEPLPLLPPPPKTPTKAFESTAPRFNPFDKDSVDGIEQAVVEEETVTADVEEEPVPALGEAGVRKTDSEETPLSPLFDEDTSQPLEIFPQPYPKEGWEMVLRQPNKKKLTGNRFWKKIYVKLSEKSVLQLFNKQEDKIPFQELPLQACYSLSEIGAQQYDQYGKIFTVKLQYKFYRERVGVRPGQISKVTQGQVTSMGDVAKLGLPLQHSPQTSQLLKIGTHFYTDIKFFIQEIEDALFRMVVHRDRVLTYKTEEVQVIAQDEFYVEQSKIGHVDKQLARVRIFFLAFITGMPSVEVGLNDINRQGKEVVGRYDIIPVVTEEWIRLEDWEFHACVIQEEFGKSRIIKFHPPDACLFELLRFRIRPPRNRELPLQVRVSMTVSSSRVEIRSDILVPGYSSRKQGQIPCENIQIRFPIPECWIYLFRTEKHFRYGSKKSAARRPGKIKGLERIMGTAQNLDPSLIEVSAGQAKYEHVFHAVVWRIPRLPKEGQGAYTQQLFLLRLDLTSFDQIPESFDQHVYVEFTMPATYVSHTTVRSVSVTNPIPPEKYVRYVSKHEYKVEIEFKSRPDDIDGLMTSTNVANVPVTASPAVQESTEEEKDDDSD